MNHNVRIASETTFPNAIVALAEGNPGAMRVMIEMAREIENIDPDAMMGPWAPLIALDAEAIYGSDIWLLYKDLCGEDYVRINAVLRASQLGFLRQEDLRASIERCKRFEGDLFLTPEKIGELHTRVCDRLPRHAKPMIEA